MTLEQVEAAGAKVWLDEALVVRFAGPDSVKDVLRSDPAIKTELRKDLMVREFCQICRRWKSRSHDLKVFWGDLESLPRKVALGMPADRARDLVVMLLGIVRSDWEPKTGKELEKMAAQIFQTTN